MKYLNESQNIGVGGKFWQSFSLATKWKIDINNQRNFRTRSSVLVNINGTNILIDTSPDLRQQLYDAKCTQINISPFYTRAL